MGKRFAYLGSCPYFDTTRATYDASAQNEDGELVVTRGDFVPQGHLFVTGKGGGGHYWH